MKKLVFLFTLILFCSTIIGQVTLIPDSHFEQVLINKNIDSDGVVNGQVLTSDIASITTFEINDFFQAYQINDITGIENFTSLENLTIMYTNITSLNVSQNMQLRQLNCSKNNLTQIDVSNNILLEELNCGKNGEDDTEPLNQITYIDLSNNPNIRIIHAENLFNIASEGINVANNNNNSQMIINVYRGGVGGWTNTTPVCIQVDNVTGAIANNAPYSTWNVTGGHRYSGTNCSLGNVDANQLKIIAFPNPVKNVLNIECNQTIDRILIYDILGRKTIETKNSNQINVEKLYRGVYLLQASINDTIISETFIKE